MGLAGTLARRSLLQRPGRTIFSILGVAVGIATVVCVFTLDHVTLVSRTWVDPSWRADLELRAGEGVPNPRGTLSSTSGVSDVAAFFQNEAVLRRDEGEGVDSKRQGVHVVAMDAGMGLSIGAYHISEGRDFETGALDLPEVLLGVKFAADAEIEAGDTVLISRRRRAARTVCREGEEQRLEARSLNAAEQKFQVVGLVSGEGVGRRQRGRVVLMDYAAGRELFKGAHVEPRFWIKRDPTVDLEDLGASLGRSFSYELNRSVVVGQMEDERAFRNGIRMAGLLAMILGLYVIFHTLSMSLIERLREVAVLHALGCRRRQIARVFFLEALIIALSAGFVGLLGGLGLAKFLLSRGITTLGVAEGSVDVFEVPWRLVLPLTVLGVGIALLGSVFPLTRSRRADTVRALRGEDFGPQASMGRSFQIFTAVLLVGVVPALYFLVVPVVGAADRILLGSLLSALAVMAVLIALPLVVPSIVGMVCGRLAGSFERAWPLAGKLAARSIEQGPSRIAASVAAVALVTASFVGLRGLTASLSSEVEIWGAEAMGRRVFVTNLPDVQIEGFTEALHALPEVVAVESGDARAYVPFLMIGLSAEELANYGPAKRRRNIAVGLEREQGIVISKRLARHRDIGVGDAIAINTTGHGVQSFDVIAVTDEYGYFSHPDERMYGIVDDSIMHRYFCLDIETTSSVAVTLRHGADADVVMAATLGALPEQADTSALRFETGEELLEHHLEDIGQDFVLFDIILGLTALLAGVGVLNGQLLAALERTKELGVLRALGTTRRQVAGMVLLESCVLGAIGGLVGLVVGSALTPMGVEALQLISGLPLAHRFDGVDLALCFVGAVTLTALAGLYPIWKMNRLDAVRAVRTG